MQNQLFCAVDGNSGLIGSHVVKLILYTSLLCVSNRNQGVSVAQNFLSQWLQRLFLILLEKRSFYSRTAFRWLGQKFIIQSTHSCVTTYFLNQCSWFGGSSTEQKTFLNSHPYRETCFLSLVTLCSWFPGFYKCNPSKTN